VASFPEARLMAESGTLGWMARPEGGGRIAFWLISAISFCFGRSPARFILMFVAAYYVIRRAPERRASKDYLRRVLGRAPTLRDVWRHMFVFATVTLDRVFLLTEAFRRFEIRSHGIEAVENALRGGRGLLLVGAHVGSLDALRVLALARPDVRIRVVIDLGQNPNVSRYLNALNPDMAGTIINSRRDDMTTALAIHEELSKGALVTVLADRARPGNSVADVDLFGSKASLPTSIWQLAASVKVPVVLCFGLFRGGRRYDLYFEQFTDRLELARARRAAALQEVVQRFANRLEYHVRLAPYNWFNFYDVWQAGRQQ
jgi:predicted LPLAT superfamily acyltransferase